MLSVLRSIPHHAPFKQRCPIKKSCPITPTYLIQKLCLVSHANSNHSKVVDFERVTIILDVCVWIEGFQYSEESSCKTCHLTKHTTDTLIGQQYWHYRSVPRQWDIPATQFIKTAHQSLLAKIDLQRSFFSDLHSSGLQCNPILKCQCM